MTAGGIIQPLLIGYLACLDFKIMIALFKHFNAILKLLDLPFYWYSVQFVHSRCIVLLLQKPNWKVALLTLFVVSIYLLVRANNTII